MIGRHECKHAHETGLREAIAIGLDEVLTALEETFYDLSDEQVWAFPIPGRNSIAWIVMHCLQNLDTYANAFQTGSVTFPHEKRWDLWRCSDEERPKPGDPFPTRDEMMFILKAVRDAATKGIEAATDDDLRGKRTAHDWWQGTSADAYMRTIGNTTAHTRQIWLLRGALGLTDGKSWPQQHWA
jgi:hypothetical protein